MKLSWPLVEAHESVQRNFDDLANALPNTPLAQTFIQLASGATRKIAFGVATYTYPGATANSNILTTAHTLGVTPAVVLLSGINTPIEVFALNGASTSTNFFSQACRVVGAAPGAGATTFAAWIAIG